MTRNGDTDNVDANDRHVQCLNRYNPLIAVQWRFNMSTSNDQDDNGAELTFRSGVAARLAGLSAETLRVWERRYDLSAARRSARGQRLYTAEQVQRLSLLKQLVDRGHPIGQLAHLPIADLRTLGGAVRDGIPVRPIDVVVVGLGLARRIAASPHDTLLLNVQASCSRFEPAQCARAGLRAEVLLVELAELDEHAVPMIEATSAALHAAAVVVLYRFSSSATIRALRAQGWLVARVPSEMGELVPLCRQALEGQHLPQRAADLLPAGPRFDDEMLASLTAASSKLACECPRHMAELLMMIGSFERYSAQCASRNNADAQLHQDLYQSAGQARMILEAALERLAHAEGIPLPPRD